MRTDSGRGVSPVEAQQTICAQYTVYIAYGGTVCPAAGQRVSCTGTGLVIWILASYFLLAICEILMEYFVIYCAAGVTDDLANRASNTRMLFGWWITVFCRVFMTFLTFVGHFGVKRGYQAVLVLATAFYLYHLVGARKYVGKSEPVKIRMRRKWEKNW